MPKIDPAVESAKVARHAKLASLNIVPIPRDTPEERQAMSDAKRRARESNHKGGPVVMSPAPSPQEN